jgi:hypothetical protein
MRTFRNSDEIFQTAAFKFEKTILYMYLWKRKWGIIKIRKRIPALSCLGPFNVILKLSVATRLEYRAKGVCIAFRRGKINPGGRPTRTLPDRELWTLENPKQFTCVLQKGDDCCLLVFAVQMDIARHHERRRMSSVKWKYCQKMCCLGAHLPDYIKCPGYADVKREGPSYCCTIESIVAAAAVSFLLSSGSRSLNLQ